MLDSILKYISVITVAGAAISFGIGFWKYLDQRKREERTKRFELFHDLMGRVSAEAENSVHKLPLTQQIAAIYELQHFKDNVMRRCQSLNICTGSLRILKILGPRRCFWRLMKP